MFDRWSDDETISEVLQLKPNSFEVQRSTFTNLSTNLSTSLRTASALLGNWKGSFAFAFELQILKFSNFQSKILLKSKLDFFAHSSASPRTQYPNPDNYSEFISSHAGFNNA